MTNYDAIVLAGEKEAAIPVHGQNKAFLPFHGKPLLAWVVEALDRAERVSSITVVGPAEKIEPALAGLVVGKPLKALEQKENIFENIWRGALSTFDCNHPGITIEELQASDEADKAVLVLTCDLPLLTPVEIDVFLATAPLDRADFIMGIADWEMIRPYEAGPGKPGFNFMYFCVREGIYRHGNLALLRPARFGHVMNTYMPIVYRLRYQRYFRNVIGTIVQVFRYAFTPTTVYLFLVMETAKFCHRRRWYRLCHLIRKAASRKTAENLLSRIFRTRIKTHETIGPGPILDVDDEENYQTLIEKRDEWKAIQEDQIKKSLAAREARALQPEARPGREERN